MGIMDNALKIANIVSEVDNASLKKDILELLEECQNLKEENIALRQENSELKEQLEIRESLKFKDGAYWTKDGDGPFCSSCWDSDQKLIRTLKKPHILEMICPNCKNTYVTEEQRKQSAKNSMLIASLNKTNDWNF